MATRRSFCTLGLLAVLPSTPRTAKGDGGDSRYRDHRNDNRGLVNLIVYGAYAGCAAVLGSVLKRASQRSKALLSRLAEIDPAWNVTALETRAKEAFIAVMQAVSDRDPSRAAAFVTAELAATMNSAASKMRKIHHWIEIKDLVVDALSIVGVEDFLDNRKDTFWVEFIAQAIQTDITDDRADRSTFIGKKVELREFWRFSRNNDQWLVAEIRADAGGIDWRILDFDAQSETFHQDA